ncbi:dynein axonemal intermediate chain 7 [Hypomesus transpacificus]|uniref:dynein axonemal intermediate chain 7 n=1 Tax=Hypomesus transpacificus TaxID=137520 RepID=UPI001F078941|nr:dynein axonemal intermediate chain 7 [Hypomesus transpacificus]
MSAKKKGGKVSKADKERLQKEEDEKRKKEEEEARVLAEQEEMERREREREEQEEQQRLEQKDLERRDDELNELRHLLEENHSAVTKRETDSREKAKWDRYMLCDGSPDPAVQQEINTFINLWIEDQEIQIEKVLKCCDLALRLTEELDGLLGDHPNLTDAQRYQETLLSLQNLIHAKHLITTEEILKWAKAHSDIETGNMQTVVQGNNTTLCLWANLNKNPRFKGYHFEEVNIGFELPKQLAVSDIAVRILHTHYDHLSPLARLTRLRAQTPSSKSLVGGEERQETPVMEEGETGAEGEGRESAHPGGGTEDEVQSVRGSEGRKSAVSVLSVKEDRKSTLKTGSVEGEVEIQMEGAIPAGEGDSSPTPVELVIDSSEMDRGVDLQQYTPLGGVFYCNVFCLPPQAQQLNSWEMRKILETGLQEFQYPTEQVQIQSSGSATSRMEDSTPHTSPPVGLTITLPDSVLFLEDPHVACWDPHGQYWTTDSISEVSYDAAERRISFKMESFCPVSLLQDTYANMPFQGWELRPLEQDSAQLTITGALIEVSIIVKGNQCMLQSDQDTGLNHILGVWMSFSDLQKAMVNAGVNVFVNEHSDKYVSISAKDPLMEHAVYEQMALLSSTFAFSWSQWNAQCGQDHLVLQVCEHLGAGPVEEEAWSVYLLGAQRSQRLRIRESSEAFSTELHPGSEFHSTFLHMLRDYTSPAGLDRSRKSHYQFVDTVQQLLCATQPLTYS